MHTLVVSLILLAAAVYAADGTPKLNLFTGNNPQNWRVGVPASAGTRMSGTALVYSTFAGGSGDENRTGISNDPVAAGIAVDAAGNTYVTGNTTSPDFPTAKAAQGTLKGGTDAFVLKLDAAGALLWATYLGGSGIERGFGVALDAAGNVWVTGRTQSPDFPVLGALQANLRGNEDGFVAKLDSGGVLRYATYLGGSGSDDAHAIALDPAGNVVVTGGTGSADFPVVNASQGTFRGGDVDAYVSKLKADGSGLVYSTFLGGSGLDHPQALATDSSGAVYVAGYTASPDFPLANPLQGAFAGVADVFVAKLDGQGAVVYSTFLGGSGGDVGTGLAVDAEGNMYVAGATYSVDFPVAGASPGTLRGQDDGFVTKVNAAGSALVWSRYLGGSGSDQAFGISLDGTGAAWVTGITKSADFPVTAGAIQSALGNVTGDAFIVKLETASPAVAFATYLGGTDSDSGMAIAPDRSGGAVLTGVTRSPDWQRTAGAFQSNYGGGQSDAFVARIGGAPAGLASVSAASSAPGRALAPGSIASAYGQGLAAGPASATALPLPQELNGTSLEIRDSAGGRHRAGLFYVSAGQINFLIPESVATGAAQAVVIRNGQEVASGALPIETVSPGLFTANANGQGAAVGEALRVAADDSRSSQMICGCGATYGSCTTVPIDLGAALDKVYLVLYGTGFRGRTGAGLSGLEATVGGEPAAVYYAGAQGTMTGLDQLNLLLPRSLAGRGEVSVLLKVDGKDANPVQISIR